MRYRLWIWCFLLAMSSGHYGGTEGTFTFRGNPFNFGNPQLMQVGRVNNHLITTENKHWACDIYYSPIWFTFDNNSLSYTTWTTDYYQPSLLTNINHDQPSLLPILFTNSLLFNTLIINYCCVYYTVHSSLILGYTAILGNPLRDRG